MSPVSGQPCTKSSSGVDADVGPKLHSATAPWPTSILRWGGARSAASADEDDEDDDNEAEVVEDVEEAEEAEDVVEGVEGVEGNEDEDGDDDGDDDRESCVFMKSSEENEMGRGGQVRGERRPR